MDPRALSQYLFGSMIARADRAAYALLQCNKILQTSRHCLQSFFIKFIMVKIDSTLINFIPCDCIDLISCHQVTKLILPSSLSTRQTWLPFSGWSTNQNMSPINRRVETWMPVFQTHQSQFGILPVNNFTISSLFSYLNLH